MVRESSLRTFASGGTSRIPTTTRSGCFSASEPSGSRAVSAGSSASTVPLPTMIASAAARRRCRSNRAASLEIHRLVPSAAALRPSRLLAYFHVTCGNPVRCLCSHSRNGPPPTSSASTPDFDLHSRLRQPGRAARRDLVRVGDGVGDRAHAGVDQRVHARRGLAVVVTRLQRDDRGAPGRQAAGPAQRQHLGVVAAGRLGAADADHLAVGVQNHRSDRRIRIGAALDQIGLFDGQTHRGVEALDRLTAHRRRCGDAAPAWRRSAATAASGSWAP